MKTKVSVIIPNWNGWNLLKVCLNSLKKQTYSNFETIIVDNGSSDGSFGYIKKFFPKIQIIALDKNYGFARAVNEGIKKAAGDYIILINNDTEVDKYCLEFLVKAAGRRQEVGFIAAKMLNFYKRDIIDSAGDYIDIVGHANNIGLGEKDGATFNLAKEVFLATGGGSLFKKKVFEKVGLFDENYFAYMEDVDFCLRAQMQGYKGWYEPKAVIYHIHKATGNRNKSNLEYLQFRNMIMTIIKDFPTALLWRNFNWLLIILVNLNTVFYLSIKGFFWQAIKAEIYILVNLPLLLRKRFKIQKNKKVSNEYLIGNFHKKKISFYGLLNNKQ